MTWHNVMKSSKLKPGKKMKAVKGKMVMLGRQGTALFATEALCRHMRWPLAWGAKVEDDCVRCPLHQTTYNLDDGSVVEWSPFPLFPAYGKLVGAMSKKKDLRIYEARPRRHGANCLRPRRTHPLFPLNERLPHQFTSILTSIEDVAPVLLSTVNISETHGSIPGGINIDLSCGVGVGGLFPCTALTVPAGFGLATMTTPIFLLWFEPHHAIAGVAIVHGAHNAMKSRMLRTHIDRDALRRFGWASSLVR